MYIRLLFPALLFSACCTKKYCTYPADVLEVRLVYKNYSPQELKDVKVYITNQSDDIIDSTENFSGDSVVLLYTSMTSGSYPPVTKNNYIASIAGRSDTISSIEYDVIFEKIACNQCFPAGDGRADVTRLGNLRFYYKGKTVYADSVLIVK